MQQSYSFASSFACCRSIHMLWSYEFAEAEWFFFVVYCCDLSCCTSSDNEYNYISLYILYIYRNVVYVIQCVSLERKSSACINYCVSDYRSTDPLHFLWFRFLLLVAHSHHLCLCLCFFRLFFHSFCFAIFFLPLFIKWLERSSFRYAHLTQLKQSLTFYPMAHTMFMVEVDALTLHRFNVDF